MKVGLLSLCRDTRQKERGELDQAEDTGQKKTPEKKDGRRMSFQRPKGTTEYSVSNAQVTLDCVKNVLFVPLCVCVCVCVCVSCWRSRRSECISSCSSCVL
ncbi:unnamed protein product [Tetraodon nigroviridis]|uniref:(spotted green pufferfish) hypothetical protein n=1 Tax=Tetraodon nigroviridis TaxID=99883 RepID=Q4SMS2_TETNG|nr:unnamed protein product [Tetraodon nigroviridis]